MEIEPVFACELCAVPPSLIDEHSVSAKQQVRPCQTSWDTIHETVPCTAETIIVDVSQLFYHIVWPHGGSPSDIIASIKSRLSQPPTFASLSHHILRAHLQVMLWKAVDHQAPPSESTNITHFGWEIQDGIPVTIDQSDLVPPELTEVVQRQCKAQGTMCSTAVTKNICHVLLTAIAQVKKATATHIPRKIKLKMELKWLWKRILKTLIWTKILRKTKVSIRSTLMKILQ